MKQFIALLILLAAAPATYAQMVFNFAGSGEPEKADSIDRIQFTAQYRMLIVGDTLKPADVQEETMMLQSGARCSQFYSYTRFVSDSLMRDQLKKSGTGNVNLPKGSNPGMISYRIFKNYPSGKVTTLDRVASSSFRCEEENERPAWEILPDTMTVLSYPCQKAVCRFKGRDYEAWFTTEIPRSEGPWKLYGLPGLILRAEDSQRHYVFECTGIEQASSPAEPILFPGDNREPISRKNLNRVYERFAKDPIGYITSSSPNVKIVVRNEAGESITPKDTPYNPIERVDK